MLLEINKEELFKAVRSDALGNWVLGFDDDCNKYEIYFVDGGKSWKKQEWKYNFVIPNVCGVDAELRYDFVEYLMGAVAKSADISEIIDDNCDKFEQYLQEEAEYRIEYFIADIFDNTSAIYLYTDLKCPTTLSGIVLV